MNQVIQHQEESVKEVQAASLLVWKEEFCIQLNATLTVPSEDEDYLVNMKMMTSHSNVYHATILIKSWACNLDFTGYNKRTWERIYTLITL